MQSWQAHEMVVYALALDENRLFSSSSEGEIKEWDPTNGEFRQMTILNVSFALDESVILLNERHKINLTLIRRDVDGKLFSNIG